MSSTTLDRIKLVALVLLVLGALVTVAGCDPAADAAAIQNAGGGPGGPNPTGGDTLGLGGQPVGQYRTTSVTGSIGWCTYGAELWFYTYTSHDPAAAAAVTGNGNQVAGAYAAHYHLSTSSTPAPGALVSWPCVGSCAEGHVGFVASVQTSGGTIASYTVWEMNYEGNVKTGDGIVDSRKVRWPDTQNPVFFDWPTPVDPPSEAGQYGTWPSGTKVV